VGVADYKLFFPNIILVKVINKLYVRNIKEILAEPTRIITCYLQQGRINSEYSIVLCKTYPLEGNKRLQGYARLGSLHLQETLLNVRPYIQFYYSHH
jgi:hypothetical protein